MNQHSPGDLFLLDGPEVKRRRRRLGMSRRELADRIGVAPSTVTGIEQSTNHDVLNGRLLDRLAGALGTTLGGLLASSHAEPPADGGSTTDNDVARLGALYVEAGGNVHNDDAATALRISRRRVVDAQPRLREALRGTGIELRRGSWSQVALRPAGALVGAQELRRLNHAQLARRGLRFEDARLLRDLRDGLIDREWEKRVGATKRGRLGRLLDLGLADEPDAGVFGLSDAVRFSLMLDD